MAMVEPFQAGVERLLADPQLRSLLAGRSLAYLGHAASVLADGRHALDALVLSPEFRFLCAFGPQHGMRGEKQDNMVESEDYVDSEWGLPVYSLYGATRRPTSQMLSGVDVVLVDLQDLGCRIYTFATTLLYMIEESAARGIAVWVLERPNPAGRPVEGLSLLAGWESFVGHLPTPMRHGLTLGELGRFLIDRKRLDLEYRVVGMQGWMPDAAPGFGWPLETRSWVNPSPNAPQLSMARCYSGTVLLEGTHLSEGRGTTRPLEMVGAPDLDGRKWVDAMHRMLPSSWLAGCRLRPCFFQPTFQKHQGKVCSGFQIHCDGPDYRHDLFRPFRLVSGALWTLRRLRPDYPIWRDFPYEYETDRLAFDLIAGSDRLRRWVDDPSTKPDDLERVLNEEELAWRDLSDRYRHTT